MSGPGIGPEYFNGDSYCPALSRGRRWLAQLDANLFFYYKAHLATYCDWEDSYWRFFVDAWVRGILTTTDSWLLLFSEGVRALIFEEFFRVLLTPCIALAYALVAALFVLIEWEIFKVIYEDCEGDEHRATKLLTQVETAVKRVSFASKVVIRDKKRPPPLTLYRKRPSEDWLEMCRYWYDRQTRTVSYHRAQAQSACRFVLRGTLWAAFIIRVVCLLFGNISLFWLVDLVGLSTAGDRHMQWFAQSTGLDTAALKAGDWSSDTKYSDWLVSVGVTQALSKLPLIGSVGEDVGQSAVGALRPLLRKYLIPAFVLLPPPFLFAWKIRRQRDDFKVNWKKSTCKELFGAMSKTAPAANWEQVRFSSRPLADGEVR